MLRYDEWDKISDGRKYSSEDMVAAGTHGCNGCSKCCESDMGSTIVLTPYDIFNLTSASGMSFDEMLTGFYIEISMIDGIALPHLKMDSGCKFLKDGRCEVHQHRPGICRLFPLGRIYEDKGFSYFLQINECPVPDKEEVRVKDWLGIEDLEKNTAFINKWHKFIKYEKKKVSEIRERAFNLSERIKEMDDKNLEVFVEVTSDRELFETFADSEKSPGQIISEYRKHKSESVLAEAEEDVKRVMKNVLAFLYLDKYDVNQDFYEQFDNRLRKCLKSI